MNSEFQKSDLGKLKTFSILGHLSRVRCRYLRQIVIVTIKIHENQTLHEKQKHSANPHCWFWGDGVGIAGIPAANPQQITIM